jgi:hypothetical protein
MLALIRRQLGVLAILASQRGQVRNAYLVLGDETIEEQLLLEPLS